MTETTIDPSEMKQPELKQLLTDRGIDFPNGVVSNDTLRGLLAESEGGTAGGWASKGYEGPQPWEDREEPSVVIAHDMPIVASGSAGAAVFELCRLLAELGYETDVTRGVNAFGVYGPAEATAVQRFREDYGVREDPTGFGGESEDAIRLAAAHVGPWTWEGILRAAAGDVG